MGIGPELFKLFEYYNIAIDISEKDFANYSPLLIDTSYVIHSALKALAKITALSDAYGSPTGHIQNILQMILRHYKANCRDIFIFDGKPPEIKMDEMNARQKLKDVAQVKIDKLEDAMNELNAFCDEKFDMESLIVDKNNQEKKTFKLDDSVTSPIKQLLSCLGVPFIQAEEEADVAIAQLVRMGLGKCTYSKDSDMLIYGIPYLISPYKNGNKKAFKLYSLETIYKKMNINHRQLIIIAICLGNDYDKGVKGVGLETIKKHIAAGTLDSLATKFNTKQLSIVERFASPPVHAISYDVESPNIEAFVQFLLSKGFEKTAEKYKQQLIDLKFNYAKYTAS